MVVRVYQADLAQAQADPVLAAMMARGTASAPFDRLDWLRLLADECLPGRHCTIAVAREGDAAVALPLLLGPRGAEALANWYSFRVRPVANDPACADVLLAALARSLRGFGALSLSPMPGEDAELLARALRVSGWIGTMERSDSNHVLEVAGRTFAAYWAARPGQLRETVRRKSRKGAVGLRIATRFDPADWDAYEAVYRQSWKPGEGSPAFLRRFAEAEGAADALRLGLAEVDGKTVAAQFWTVEGGTAWIHKLAHDESAKSHSPGTLLSAALFEHVIDRDGVHTIDFGTGDDPYKRDWMERVRPRYRLEFAWPGAVRQWPRIARIGARRVRGALVSAGSGS